MTNKNYTLTLGLILGVLSAVLLVLTGAWRAVPASLMGTSYSSAPILIPIYTNPILNVSSTPTFMSAPTFTSSTSTSTPIFVSSPTYTSSTSTSVPTTNGPEICTDGIDNDQDGMTDCDDIACMNRPECQTHGSGLQEDCFNKTATGQDIDDDADGAANCADYDCLSACMNGSTASNPANSNAAAPVAPPTLPFIPSGVSLPTSIPPVAVPSPSSWYDSSYESEDSYMNPFDTPLIDDSYLEPYNYDLVPEVVPADHSAPETMTEEAIEFRNSFIPFLRELLKWFKF